MLRIVSEALESEIKALHQRNTASPAIYKQLTQMAKAIQTHGDRALLDYTSQFDQCTFGSGRELLVHDRQSAYDQVSDTAIAAIQRAITNIRHYHQHQVPKNWRKSGGPGVRYGAQYRPLDAVGLYVPGGRAPLVSTAIMTAVPAAIAGVPRMVLATPPRPDGTIHPAIIVAADLAGVHEIYKLGGAQAVFGLAYGTESIQAVDKIVGPGNQYVTQAKQMVYGTVDIDKPAGPSEVLIAVESIDYAARAAADLLCQLEHDPLAVGCVVSTQLATLQAIRTEVVHQLPERRHRKTIEAALAHAALFHVKHTREVLDVINQVASEHLVLLRDDFEDLLPQIRHAGSIFCGPHTPVTAGDYYAGPNHVLPTSGSARFASPLGVMDYMKYNAILAYEPTALANAEDDLAVLTDLEGLEAHFNAVSVRLS
jgi:histidinol dehydrogenase